MSLGVGPHCCCEGGGDTTCAACDADQALANFRWHFTPQTVNTNSTETMYDLCMRLVGFFCGIYTDHGCDDDTRPQCGQFERPLALSPLGSIGADDLINGDPFYSPWCTRYETGVEDPEPEVQTEVFRYKTLCILGAGTMTADNPAIHRLDLGGATTGTFTVEGDDDDATLNVVGLTATAVATAWNGIYTGSSWYAIRDSADEFLIVAGADNGYGAPTLTDDSTDGTVVVSEESAPGDDGPEPCLEGSYVIGLARDTDDNTWLWARVGMEDRLGFFVRRDGQGQLDLETPWGEVVCNGFDETVSISPISVCEQYQDAGQYYDYDDATYCAVPTGIRVQGSVP